MKKKSISTFLCATLILVAISFSDTSIAQEKKRIQFEKTSHNFGKINQYKPVFNAFVFKNISPYPVVIEDVKTSCGCTTPRKPKKPTMPGKSDTITVGYNAASLGRFRKTIMVKIAGSPKIEEVVISGEVTKK